MDTKLGRLFNQSKIGSNYKDNKDLKKIERNYENDIDLNQVKINYGDNKNDIKIETNYNNNKDNLDIETNYDNDKENILQKAAIYRILLSLHLHLVDFSNLGNDLVSMAEFDIMQSSLSATFMMINPGFLTSTTN